MQVPGAVAHRHDLSSSWEPCNLGPTCANSQDIKDRDLFCSHQGPAVWGVEDMMELSILVPERILWESLAHMCLYVCVCLCECARKALMGKRRCRPTQEPASPTLRQTVSHKQLSFLPRSTHSGSTGWGSESQIHHFVACGLGLSKTVFLSVKWA